MMGLSEIKRLSREAAQRASKRKQLPYVPYDEEEIKSQHFTIPNLGDHRPKDWALIEELFCDKSGFGARGEKALTLDQLLDKMIEYQKAGKTHGYGMIEEGQFQCVVGVFQVPDKKTKSRTKNKSKKAPPK